MFKNDTLQIYRGNDFIVNDKITIHQPTLGEICEWGEEKYFSFIYGFTATPTDRKHLLNLSGIDWNTITDYEMFLRSYTAFDKSLSGIVFKDIDFKSFYVCQNQENDEVYLYNPINKIKFDRSIYEISVDYLRRTHNIKKNVEIAMNDTTKEVLLEEAKENYDFNKDKEFQSILLPLISTMINMSEFKYGWTDVWDMKINAFMDSVYRVQHIKNADLMLSSGYSGFGIDLKKINKNNLNYFYRPNEN